MSKYKLQRNGSVLMIIDLQEKLMKVMKTRDKVYNNVNLLLAAAKELKLPVILTEQYPRGLGATVKQITHNLPPNYYYLEKTSFSAYVDEMKAILNKTGRKTILVTGSETHVCVFQTTRDLVEANYKVHLVKDAVCSRFDENYQNGLELMEKSGAVINNTETVLFDLLEYSNTPEFKAILPLLK
jgi:nicotinamidase-related amidase